MAGPQNAQFPDIGIGRFLGDLRIPDFSVDAFATSQRRNFDTLTQAGRLAYEGMQAAAQQHLDIMRHTMDGMVQAAKGIAEPGTAQDKASMQMEMVKTLLERTFADMRGVGETIAKANTDVFDLLNHRLAQSLDELREAFTIAAAPR